MTVAIVGPEEGSLGSKHSGRSHSDRSTAVRERVVLVVDVHQAVAAGNRLIGIKVHVPPKKIRM